MKYECPSCFLQWEDSSLPLDFKSHPLCVFCSAPHDQAHLLDWQISHIENLNPEKIKVIIKHFYYFFRREVERLEGKKDGKGQQ